MTANIFCTARDEVRAVRLIDEMRQAGFALPQFSIFVPEHAVAGGFRPATVPQVEGTIESPPATGSFCEVLYHLDGVIVATCAELGRCLATGELAVALQAASADGASHMANNLAHSGVPQPEIYQQSISEGSILFSVRCHGLEETTRAQLVLVRAGAEKMFATAATLSPDSGPESWRYYHAA